MEDNQPILILCRDLLLSSKITAAAKSLGVPYALLRDPAVLATRDGVKLIVDLNEPAALEAAVAWRNRTKRPVIAFVAHTDIDTILRAREAGLDQVMPRGRFFETVDQWLRA
jgi:hypothetical protein